MKSIFKIFTIFTIALSFVGCEVIDIDTPASSDTYVYQTDIKDAVKYNAGSSDYVVQGIGSVDYKMLQVDYSLAEATYENDFKLMTKNKITLPVKVKIVFQLVRNPNQAVSISDDEYLSFYMENIKAVRDGGAYVIRPLQAYNVLMKKDVNRIIRGAFVNPEMNELEKIEDSLNVIADDIQAKLNELAKANKIKVKAVYVEDIVIPQEIEEARTEALKIEQDKINNMLKIESELDTHQKEMVKKIRKATTEVFVDQIVANNVDKGYMLVEAIQTAADKGSLALSVTPDFMRYLQDTDDKGAEGDSESKALFKKLMSMDDETLEIFLKNPIK